MELKTFYERSRNDTDERPDIFLQTSANNVRKTYIVRPTTFYATVLGTVPKHSVMTFREGCTNVLQMLLANVLVMFFERQKISFIKHP